LGIKHDTAIPNDLSGYNILICSDGACDSTTANYIDLFLQDGGSAIIMGGTPYLLAGNTGDLSLISDWFGAGSYGNDGGSGTVTVPNPFGLSGDKVDYSASNSAPAVYNLNPGESVEISAWSGGGTHSFIHSYGQGRVFYYAGNPGYSGDSDPITVGNGLVLFEAGLFWTVADCPMPSITIPPESQTILSGETTTLSVAAMDTTLLSYQWYQGPSGDTSTPVGTNSSNYITPALTQTTSYWVRVSNSCGTYADSDTAIITMAGSCTAPSITSDPQNQTIQSGQTATLSVSASGTTLTYQWYQGLSGDSSNPISGATSSSFTTPALTQTTNYWVKVSNSCGYADSNAAAITVISAPVGSAPLANDDSVIWKRRTRFIAVLANDYDPDGMLNPSSVAIVTPPANGIATPITTGRRRRIGRVVYWPNAGFHGVDSFTYTVADNNGNISNVAKVTVTVP
jgi:hypothetical protein